MDSLGRCSHLHCHREEYVSYQSRVSMFLPQRGHWRQLLQSAVGPGAPKIEHTDVPQGPRRRRKVVMKANAWLWIALLAFLVFCCLPMLRMGRHKKSRSEPSPDNSDAER